MFLSAIGSDVGALRHCEFDTHESGRPEHSVRSQLYRAAVGGHVSDAAVIIGPASPIDARGADEFVAEGLAGHDRTPQPRRVPLQWLAFDDMVRVTGEVGDTAVLI